MAGVKPVLYLTVHYQDGDHAHTRFNGTPDEARAYYIGQTFNVGMGPEDNFKDCVSLDIEEGGEAVAGITLNLREHAFAVTVSAWEMRFGYLWLKVDDGHGVSGWHKMRPQEYTLMLEQAWILAHREDEARITLDCGHIATPSFTLVPKWREYADTPGQGVTGWTGYATLRDGRRVCAHDAAELDRAEMAAGRAVVAYVSADGQHVTSWPGETLARVTGHTSADSGFNRSTVHNWWAQSPDGRQWWGRNGGPGMALTLRPIKGRQA